MGKQINFYMTCEDERDFVQFACADTGLTILRYAMPTKEVAPLSVLPETGEAFWFAVWFWNRNSSPPPALKYVAEQQHYAVDDLRSEVIQFSRSHGSGRKLERGRIWAEFRFWQDDGTLNDKSEAFRKGFNRMVAWIKRNSVRDAHGDWVMPGAAQFVAGGGALVRAVT